jgi:hypothetical protein
MLAGTSNTTFLMALSPVLLLAVGGVILLVKSKD